MFDIGTVYKQMIIGKLKKNLKKKKKKVPPQPQKIFLVMKLSCTQW